MACVHAERAAVCRQLLHVEHAQRVALEQGADRREDRNSCSARGRWCRTGSPASNVPQVLELGLGKTPSGRSSARDAGGRNRAGRVRAAARCWRPRGRLLRSSCNTAAARASSEECDARRYASPTRNLGDVRRRFEAEARDPAPDEVLQQVAVIARRFDDEAPLAQSETARHRARVVLGIAPRGTGVRREIGIAVIAEDRLARHAARQLHQPALAAQQDAERVEHLGLVQCLGRYVLLTQGRIAEVDDHVRERRLA